MLNIHAVLMLGIRIFASPVQDNSHSVERTRLWKVITAALIVMMTGTAVELYLLEHYEDFLQLIPLICIGAALLLTLVLLYRPTPVMLTIYKVLMVITALSGFLGVFLHLRANYEFEKEMKSTAADFDLIVEGLSGALPSLAPASLVVLALVGYSYTLLLKQRL